MKPTTDKRFQRSAVVGLVATLADLITLAVFVHGLGVSAALANVPALALGVLIQFVGNKIWAFEERSTEASVLMRQGSMFLAVEVVAFALNAALFHLAAVVFAIPALFARIAVSSLVYFGFSYRLWARIFRPARSGLS